MIHVNVIVVVDGTGIRCAVRVLAPAAAVLIVVRVVGGRCGGRRCRAAGRNRGARNRRAAHRTAVVQRQAGCASDRVGFVWVLRRGGGALAFEYFGSICFHTHTLGKRMQIRERRLEYQSKIVC